MLSVNIRKRLGGFLLDVNFETEGETMALMGPSGCGKSMTLKCIAGIERPDSGRIVLHDRVLYDSEARVNLTPQKRRVGYLFQQYALFPNMTVEQNIAVGCRTGNKGERRKRTAWKIREMHLEGLERKRPHQLSGGQQQRVALARILINEPELLLLDEPFTALDNFLKWQLELELFELLGAYGRGALFVSHSPGEVRRLCDSVCILRDGRSEVKQTVHRLFERPATRTAAELTGCKNFSRAVKMDDRHVRAADWGMTFVTKEPVPEQMAYLGVYPPDIVLSDQEEGQNRFPCDVTHVIEDIGSVVVMLKPVNADGNRTLLRAELSKEKWNALRSPDRIYVHIPPDGILLLQ